MKKAKFITICAVEKSGGKENTMKKQKRILKKVISVILALAMIISLVNVPAIGSEAASKKKTVKSVTVSNLPAKTLTLKKNKTFQLKTKVTVTGKASKAVIYKSSKPKVAQVNSKGVITAKKKKEKRLSRLRQRRINPRNTKSL